MAKQFTEPKISPESLDMSENWYVWFRFFNARTGAWQQFRYKKGINRYTSKKDRLAEANALRQVLKEELEAGWSPLQEDPQEPVRFLSLEECLNTIFNIKQLTLKKKSQEAYRYITKLFKEWLTDHQLILLKADKFTANMAMQYMDYLQVKMKYSARTWNDHLIVLSTFFNAMVDREWIPANPFKKIKRKKNQIGRNHAFSSQEKELLDRLLIKKNIRLYYFKEFMYYGFIRRPELCSLQVKHIDRQNNTIIIPGEHAKNLSQESVVIPKGLEPVLDAMELHRYHPDDFVFGRSLATCSRKYGNMNHISTLHNTICRDAGIPPEKGLYSWKHTGVCAAYFATGKDIHSIMRQLRHRDLATTMIYLKSLGLVQNDVFRNAMTA